MFGNRAATTLASLSVMAILACASASEKTNTEPKPMVGLGYGTEIPLANATTNAKTLPATALFDSGPYGLNSKLAAYGMTTIGESTPIWIDGTRHFGIEALHGLTMDDIVRVDVVRNVWSGLQANPLFSRDEISITTKRALKTK